MAGDEEGFVAVADLGRDRSNGVVGLEAFFFNYLRNIQDPGNDLGRLPGTQFAAVPDLINPDILFLQLFRRRLHLRSPLFRQWPRGIDFFRYRFTVANQINYHDNKDTPFMEKSKI